MAKSQEGKARGGWVREIHTKSTLRNKKSLSNYSYSGFFKLVSQKSIT